MIQKNVHIFFALFNNVRKWESNGVVLTAYSLKLVTVSLERVREAKRLFCTKVTGSEAILLSLQYSRCKQTISAIAGEIV